MKFSFRFGALGRPIQLNESIPLIRFYERFKFQCSRYDCLYYVVRWAHYTITCHDMMSRRENRNKLKRMKINDAANAIIYKQNIHSNRISAKIMPLHNISEL